MRNTVEVPRYVVSKAVRETATSRLNNIYQTYLNTGALPRMTHVADQFSKCPFSSKEEHRLDRYAEILEPALGFPYVIRGDGQNAEFKNFQQIPPLPGENLYRTFNHSLRFTFLRGWTDFEMDMEAHYTGLLDAIRDRYQELWTKDETGRYTGQAINYKNFRIGVELGNEVAYAAMGLGLAIDNSKDIVPELADPKAVEERKQFALEKSSMVHARTTANLHEVFWTKRKIYAFAEYDSLKLSKQNGKLILNQRNGQFDPYREGDPDLAKPTIGCMALYFKIHDDDKYWAIENAITAAFKAAGDMDLFNPKIARAAWEQRNKIFQRPKIANFVSRLPEDATTLKEDESSKEFWEIIQAEFI